MPAAAAADKSDRNEQMRKALKTHILRERERQKQEREAEVEEERLRKEREAREQQDVMTLGETREQIKSLETKLQQLKEEKHQLFLQLKKVLNEDDNRRRQLVKESNEMLVQTMQPAGIIHQQIFIPQSVTRVPSASQTSFKTISKRPRSPSPPPTQPAPVYHQGYAYKSAAVGNSTYPNSPQKNPQQYPNQPAPYYSVTPQEIPIYYSQGPIQPREPARAVYDNTRPQQYHMEPKQMEHYALRPPAPHGHVMHIGTIPINQTQSSQKPPNLGAAYPVRTQTQYQQVPAGASSTLYTGQNRPLYQASSTPIGYPQRD